MTFECQRDKAIHSKRSRDAIPISERTLHFPLPRKPNVTLPIKMITPQNFHNLKKEEEKNYPLNLEKMVQSSPQPRNLSVNYYVLPQIPTN